MLREACALRDAPADECDYERAASLSSGKACTIARIRAWCHAQSATRHTRQHATRHSNGATRCLPVRHFTLCHVHTTLHACATCVPRRTHQCAHPRAPCAYCYVLAAGSIVDYPVSLRRTCNRSRYSRLELTHGKCGAVPRQAEQAACPAYRATRMLVCYAPWCSNALPHPASNRQCVLPSSCGS